MSSIDERVVEMQFENKKFEKNINTSINSIENLKSSLNFEKSSKALAELEKESDNFAKSLDKVSSRFSALGVVGMRVLQNLTDSAMATGKKLVSSLSIDNVLSGYNKYEEKTASVQSLINSTGKDIDTVNGYLEKLMWFSDETSYSFTDMTSALATMSSSGGDVEKLIPLIEGVANATAFAGKTTSEFSRVMYNLNQSYSQGYLSYMDWKSVQQAGVASKQLTQTIIDMGVALGKIKEGEVTVETFADTLKNKWADTEVMEAAFGKFSEMTEAAYELVQAGEYETATEAYAAIADQFDDISSKAARSAQEAKTFTEAIEATKDAVSSGWMSTFEIIIGNYEEAKELWTSLSETLWDIFASGAEKRNDILKGALQSGWQQLLDSGIISSDALEKTLTLAGTTAGIITEEDIEAAGGFEESLKSGWITADILSESLDALMVSYTGLTEEEKKALGITDAEIEQFKELSDSVNDGSESVDEFVDKLSRMSGRDKLIQSFSNIYKAITKITDAVKDAWYNIFPSGDEADSLYNIISAIEEFTEKLIISDETAEKITSTFKGVFAIFDLVLDVVKSLARGAGNIIGSLGNLAATIGDIILSFTGNSGEVTVAVRDWIKQNDILCTAIETVANGLATVIDGIADFIKWGSQLPIVQEIIGAIGDGIWFIGTHIGDALSAVINFVKNFTSGLGDLSVVKSATDIFGNGIEGIKDFFENLHLDLSGIKGIFEKFGDTAQKVLKNVKEFASTAFDSIGSGLDFLKGKIGDFISWLSTKIGQITLGDVMTVGMGASFIALTVSITKAVSAISSAVSALTDNVFTKLSKSVSGVFTSISGVFKELQKSIKANRNVNLIQKVAIAIGILAASLFVLSKCDQENLREAAITLGLLAGGITLMVAAMAGLSKLLKTDVLGTTNVAVTIMSIAAAVLLLVAAIKQLSSIDSSALGNGLGVISILMVELTAAVRIMSASSGTLGKGALFLIAYAAAIWVLIKALNAFADINISAANRGMGVLAELIIGLGVVAFAAKGVSAGAALALVGIAASLKIIISTIDDIAVLADNGSAEKAMPILQQIANMMLMLSVINAIATAFAGKSLGGAGGSILAMSVSILVMTQIIKIIAGISPADLETGMKVIGGFFILFAAITALSKFSGANAIKAGVAIMTMSGAIAILAMIMIILSAIDSSKIMPAVAAIAVLEACFAGIMAASHLAKDCKGTITSMTIMMAALAAMLVIIVNLPADAVVRSSAVIGGIMLSLGALIVSTHFATGKIGTLIATMASMTLLIGAIGGVIYLLANNIQNGESAIQAAESIALVMPAVAVMMAALAGVTKYLSSVKMTDIGSGLGKTAIMLASALAGMFIIVEAMDAMMALLSVEFSVDTLNSGMERLDIIGIALLKMSPIFVSLGAAFAVLAKCKIGAKSGGSSSLAVVEMVASISVSLGLLLEAMDLMLAALAAQPFDTTLLNSGMERLDIIGIALLKMAPLIATLGVAFGVFAKLKIDAFSGLNALAVVAEMSVGIGASLIIILEALGGALALLSLFPVETINKGAEVLDAIATGFGTALGNLIGTFVGSAFGSGIGTALSSLMESLQPFLEGLESIAASDAVSGAVQLAEIVAALTAANLLNGLNNLVAFFLGGDDPFEALGDSLNSLIEPIHDFVNGMADLETGDISRSALILGSVADLATALSLIPTSGGIMDLWSGTSDLSFFTNFGAFGTAIKEFATNTEGVEAGSVDGAVEAGKKILELVDAIPESGGVVQWWTGENDISELVEKEDGSTLLGRFGTAITEFANNTNGISSSSVEKAVAAGKNVLELVDAIPNSGGIVQWWTGDNDISELVEKEDGSTLLGRFGTAIVEFCNNTKGISSSSVESAVDAGVKIFDLIGGMPKKDGVVQWWTGTSDITDVIKKEDGATALGRFGSAISEFDSNTRNVNSGRVDTAVEAGMTILNFIADAVETDVGGTDKISAAMGTMGEALKKFAEDTGSTNTATTGMTNMASALMTSLAQGIKAGKAQITSAFAEVINQGIITVRGYSQSTTDAGTYITKGIASGIDAVKVDGTVDTAFTQLLDAALVKINEYYTKFYDAGGYLASGLANGTSSSGSTATMQNAGVTMANTVKTSFDNTMRIASPSKVMEKSGAYVGEGVGIGIQDTFSFVKKSTIGLADVIRDTFCSELGIHSPSVDGEEKGANYGIGVGIGMVGSVAYVEDGVHTVTDAIGDTMYSDMQAITNGVGNVVVASVQEWGEKAANGVLAVGETVKDTFYSSVDDIVKSGITSDTTSSSTTKTSSSSSSSSSKKSSSSSSSSTSSSDAASKVEEQFKDRLSLLESQMEAAELEQELWENVYGKTASNVEKDQKTIDALEAKKLLMAEKVQTANEKYEAMAKLGSEYSNEIQKAYNDYLQAQIDEAELNEELQDAYMVLALQDIADREEELEYLGEISDLEHSIDEERNKYIRSEPDQGLEDLKDLENQMTRQAEQVSLSQQRYNYYLEQLGENNETTKEAYKALKEDEEELAELQNELIEQRQSNIDSAFDDIETQNSYLSDIASYKYEIWENLYGNESDDYTSGNDLLTRMHANDATEDELAAHELESNIEDLKRLYDTLAGAKDHYYSIVETFGADSQQALEAYADYLAASKDAASAWSTVFGLVEDEVERQSDIEDNYDTVLKGYMPMVEAGMYTLEEAQTLAADWVKKNSGALSTEELTNYWNMLEEMRPVIEDATTDAIENHQPEKTYVETVKEYAEGLASSANTVTNSAEEVAEAGAEALAEGAEAWNEAGGQLVEGAAQGVTDNTQTFVDATTAMGNAGLEAFKTTLQIASPSKKFIALSRFAVLGAAKGMLDNTYLVEDAAAEVGKAALNTAEDISLRVSNILASDDDFTPRITPVVDFDNIYAGAGTIRKAFAGSYGIDTSAAVKTARAAVAMNQSGGMRVSVDNHDVTDAIFKMGEKFDSMSEDIKRMKVVMNTGTLVGELSSPMDKSLGRMKTRKERGI